MEYERTIQVTDLASIQNQIENLALGKFKTKSSVFLKRIIYKKPNSEYFIRLSLEEIDTNLSIELMLKSDLPESNYASSNLKASTEIPLKIDQSMSIHEVEAFVQTLGYSKFFEYQKMREHYIFDNFVIDLDTCEEEKRLIEIESNDQEITDSIYNKIVNLIGVN